MDQFRLLSWLAVIFSAASLHAQTPVIVLSPEYLSAGDQVKIVMKDSSHFFGTVLGKPLSDRILFQTRNGQLEIPFSDMKEVIEFRKNDDLRDDLKDQLKENAEEVEKFRLRDLLSHSVMDRSSIIFTRGHDAYHGYLIADIEAPHIIITTDWGELYFNIKDVSRIKPYFDNYETKNEYEPDHPSWAKLEDTTTYVDPIASQGFITPNGIAYGKGNFYVMDYLFGGLQINYGLANWLSLNAGGVLLPLSTTLRVATGGFKITPFASRSWAISLGGQGVYSGFIKTTHLGLAYGALTYGDRGSHLSIFGGYTFDRTDSLGYVNTKHDEIFAVEAAKKVGDHTKIGIEFFFVSNFDIVPLILSLRYFTNRISIDLGVVLSLFKAGAVKTTKTLGEYVFNVADFPVLPILSGSYHF
ncbi:MAG: hypothetical protein ABI778_09905 [Ignavibacteriota bacterium]